MLLILNIIIPLLVLFIIVRVIMSIFGVRGHKKSGMVKEWYLETAFSKEHMLSQLFFLLFVLFFGVTVLSLNRDIGDPLSWRTVVLLTTILSLFVAYYFRVIYALALGLFGLGFWWVSQALSWADQLASDTAMALIFFGTLLLALNYYLIGTLHFQNLRLKRFSTVFNALSTIFIAGTLLFFSSKPGLGTLEKLTNGASLFSSWPVAIFIVAVVVGLLFLLFETTLRKKLLRWFEVLEIVLLFGVFLIFCLTPNLTLFEQSSKDFFDFDNNLSVAGIFWAIIFNILVFLKTIEIIFLGYLNKDIKMVNAGTVFLFVIIAIKYFDWFFTLLNKSLFFISAGIILVLVGWGMERGRRFMISSIKGAGQIK